MKENRLKNKRKTAYEKLFRTGIRFLGRVVAAFIALLVIFEGISFPAHAESVANGEVPQHIEKNGSSIPNTYILETSTGASTGDFIEYFLIKYTDSHGKTKRKYIFPGADSLQNGLDIANSIGNDDAVLSSVQTQLGYDLTTDYKTKKALDSYNTDQFLFSVPDAITDIQDIRILSSKNGSWTCLGLRVFAVDEVYGNYLAGVWSSCSYVDFKGTLIAELDRSGGTSIGCDNVNDISAGTLVNNFSGKSYAQHDTQDYNTFGFRLDFSDFYKAGMEGQISDYTDNKASILNMGIAETMTLNLVYEDVYGQSRILNLPMNTSTAYWLSDSKRIGNTPVLGFGQQGGSMGFTAEIPDCTKIITASISAGATDAMKAAKIQHSGSFSKASRRDNRESYSEKDEMKYTCFAIYDMKKSVFATRVEGALLKYTYIGDPMSFKVSSTADGDGILSKGDTQIMIRDYNDQNKKPLEFETGKIEGYLVQLTTDSIAAAATAGSLKIKFKYKTMTGLDKETGEYDLKDAANSFYGYWPGNVDNFSYYFGFAPGQTLSFIIQVDNVDYFTGATLSLSNDGDDYQLSSFKIYNLSNTGRKVANWEEINTGGYASRVRVSRVVEIEGEEIDLSKPGKIIDGKKDDQMKKLEKAGAINILNIDEPVLLLPDDHRKIDFVTNSVGELEDNTFDPNKYSMTYMEAMQDYNFAKERKNYKVSIKIADDEAPTTGNVNNTTILTGDGDSGSKNNFYFQLVFEDGSTSAFVLANQQLMGDYFRTGSSHTIYIKTNRDYGDITEIRVIPDDTTEDELKKDKLKIQSITVTEGNTKGTHKAWNFENINWIGTDYSDNMELLSISGKAGRSLSQVAKKIPLSYTSNIIDVEVSLQTGIGNYDTGRNAATGGIDRVYADQLQGQVKVKFDYINNQGETKSTDEIDAVKSMYDYMGKTAVYADGLATSNPQYMFREGHTDRFTVQFSNVKQITGMEIIAKTDNPYRWNIAGISGRILKSEGRLRINAKEEYQYENLGAGEDDIIFEQGTETNPAYSFDVNNVEQRLKFNLKSQEITENTQGESVVAYTRTPASKDDTLNIFVFPSGGTADPMSMYDLNAKVHYTTALTDYQKYTDLAKYNAENDPEKGRGMFFAFGVEASKMVDISRLILNSNSEYSNLRNIDFAIIQQERGAGAGSTGTVVNTYFFDIQGQNAKYGITAYPSKNRDVLGYTEEQVISVEFGPGTETAGLYPERKDIGFALEYKNSFDPTGPSHRTPIVYLTDQNITNIREGKTVDLVFNQLFIGEITGLQVIATGGIQAVVKCASVATYRQDTGSVRRNLGWYSFSQPIQLSAALTPMTRTATELGAENSCAPVTIKFKTTAAQDDMESGTQTPVRVGVTCVDHTGFVLPTYEIMDLRKYLTDDSTNFKTGEEQTVKFMVTNAAGIRRITLEPKSELFDGTAGWSIDSAALMLGDGDFITRNVKKRFLENHPLSISFSNITVSATVHNWNAQKGANDEHHVSNDNLNIIVAPGQSVYVTPSIAGSELGYSVTAVEVTPSDRTDEEFTSGALVNSLVPENGRYRFTPPTNETMTSKYYRVIVESNEAPESKAVINITIDGANQNEIYSKTIKDYSDKMTEEQKKQQQEQNKANWANVKQQSISGYQSNMGFVSPETQKLYKEIIDELEKLQYDDNKSYEDNVAEITRIVKQYLKDTEEAAALEEFNNYKAGKINDIQSMNPDFDTSSVVAKKEEAINTINSCTDYHNDYQKIGDLMLALPKTLRDAYVSDKNSEIDSLVPDIEASSERSEAKSKIDQIAAKYTSENSLVINDSSIRSESNQVISDLEPELQRLLEELKKYKELKDPEVDSLVAASTNPDADKYGQEAKEAIAAARSISAVDDAIEKLKEQLNEKSKENP
ncbi:MAG: hypothetical protein K5879_10520 [Lachnospiraceae bacterium]|nr:hypothetical protein [Lachnospiraceae bacterium]